jgi:hypothetical protein
VIQAQYLRAVLHHWSDPATNPVSDVYGGRMIDVSRAHAWAWDARPWPAFPHDLKRWSDGANWQKGHWLTGRLDAVPLDLVVAEICETRGAGALRCVGAPWARPGPCLGPDRDGARRACSR